jgi:hypothetical protein
LGQATDSSGSQPHRKEKDRGRETGYEKRDPTNEKWEGRIVKRSI